MLELLVILLELEEVVLGLLLSTLDVIVGMLPTHFIDQIVEWWLDFKMFYKKKDY